MIDRNYGDLARERRERAVRARDTLTAEAVDVRGHPVDAGKGRTSSDPTTKAGPEQAITESPLTDSNR